MTTLASVTKEMKAYNGEVAYGSECTAWQDFVANTFEDYKCAPWDDKAEELEVDDDFADYWLSVASGESADYQDEEE